MVYNQFFSRSCKKKWRKSFEKEINNHGYGLDTTKKNSTLFIQRYLTTGGSWGYTKILMNTSIAMFSNVDMEMKSKIVQSL